MIKDYKEMTIQEAQDAFDKNGTITIANGDSKTLTVEEKATRMSTLVKTKTNANVHPNDEWYTPKFVLDVVSKQFGLDFKYDPATDEWNANRLGFETYDTITTNGLDQDWSIKANGGDIWMNPPFSNKWDWLSKAAETIENGFKGRIAILIPDASLSTKSLYKYTKGKNISFGLSLFGGRITFIDKDRNQTNKNFFGSVVVVIGGNGIKQYNISKKDYEVNNEI